MTDEVTIRELIGLDEIVSIYPLLQQETNRSWEVFHQRLTAMLAQGNYRCIAAYSEGRMVGIAGLLTSNQLWCGKFIEADHVVVDNTLRSMGIGSRLMQWIEDEAERIGCGTIRIAMVLGKDRTHQFYRRNGFFDDGLIMVKALSRGAEEFPEYVASAG